MNANAEIIAELRRVLNERDEAREQLDLTKRELGRWVDRETKAVRERDSYQRQLDAIGDAIVTSITKRIEPRLSRHPVTVIMAAGALFFKIGEAIGCEFEDGDDLLEAVKELVRERDEALARCETLRELADAAAYEQGLAQRRMMDAQRERDEARAEVERLRTEVASSLAMASAEADVLRGFGCMEDGDGPCGVCRECFYRHGYLRGAEAMRKRCAMWVKHNSHEDGLGMGSQRMESALSALPIPEEP